jgi:hypothetical protein
MQQTVPMLDIDYVLEAPRDVPPEWRDAFNDKAMRDEYPCRLREHPFYKRFALDTAMERETLGHLVHYMHEYSTSECYLSPTAIHGGGNRRAALNTGGKMVIQSEHYGRLMALANHMGCPLAELVGVDQMMRRRRDYTGTITTPEGRAFLYLYQEDQWIDVSYMPPPHRPLSSSSP